MCCLFGFVDYGHKLTRKQRLRLLAMLGTSAEVRGSDATGFSFNVDGKQVIYKRPLPAHMMWYRLPAAVTTVMGHTRMATQGSELVNINNHPFPGVAGQMHFSLAHNGVADDESRLALEGYGLIQCRAYLSHIISVYFNDMPSPGAIFCGHILCVNHFRGGGELDSVGIIEHRQVVQSQRTCNAACSLGNFLLNSSVRNVGIYPLTHNVPQTGLQEFGCYGRAYREGMPLSERA